MNSDELLLRLIGGDPTAERAVIEGADESNDVAALVAAAVLTDSPRGLQRAAGLAVRPRERQLVALAVAYLEAPSDLFDALVRDHLATYPDHLLAAWLATRVDRPTHCTEREENR